MVNGPVRDQEDEGSPWPDLLWHDEHEQRKLIYQLRCTVNFENVLQLNLSRLTWANLDSIGFINERGRPIEGPIAWGSKLRGNFIEDRKEIAAFHELVRCQPG